MKSDVIVRRKGSRIGPYRQDAWQPNLASVSFAARLSGLASGLALAVRPAGLAEVSGAQGWVLEIVSAERLETIFGCP